MNIPHISALILLLAMFLSPSVARAQTYFINWTKFDNNTPAPSDGSSTNGKIPLGNDTRGDDYFTMVPAVIQDGSTYKMWYAGNDIFDYRIYYATSSNGLEWTKYDNTVPANSDGTSTNGKIPLGIGTRGDNNFTMGQSVIQDGSTYKMWYGGHDGTSWRIYYATSSNGLEWTKYDNTVPAISDGSSTNGKIPLGNNGKGDDAFAFGPSVIKDGPTDYKMWYAGSDGTSWRIYYATSSNGLEWTKYDNNIPENSNLSSTNGKIPLGSAGKGDAVQVLDKQVLKVGDTYRMWYSGSDGTNYRVYHATSPDGLTWTKLDNTIPPVSDTTNSNSRIGLGTNNRGDDTQVRMSAVIRVGERDYKMWYTGSDGTIQRIYHATGVAPAPAGTIFTFK